MQYLYKAYGDSGQLLYVGISGNWSERLHQHEKTSEWMQKTTWVRIDTYPDRESVSAAEMEAIKLERPIYNKQHSETFVHPIQHWADIKKWIKSGKASDVWHESLISSIRESALVYEKKPHKLRPAGMAMLFIDTIDFLEYNDYQICRNCKGISYHGSLKNLAKNGEDQLLEGINNAAY